MAIRRDSTVVDADGVSGRLSDLIVGDKEKVSAVVELEDGACVRVPFEAMEHHDNGGYSLAGRWREFASGNDKSLSIPVIEERVVSEVREGPGRRVRVRRRVISEEKIVEAPVWKEYVEVERVSIDQEVESMPAPRREGDVLILPCVEEVVVVETRLRLVEELRIRTVRERHVDKKTIVVRRHAIEIDDGLSDIHTDKPIK